MQAHQTPPDCNGTDQSVYYLYRPLGDVQTDEHIVPVDSGSPFRNLLKVQTVGFALVL